MKRLDTSHQVKEFESWKASVHEDVRRCSGLKRPKPTFMERVKLFLKWLAKGGKMKW